MKTINVRLCSLSPLLFVVLALLTLLTISASPSRGDELTAHSLKVINSKLANVTAPNGNITAVIQDNSQVKGLMTYTIKDPDDGSQFKINIWDMDVSEELGKPAGSKFRVLHCLEIVHVGKPGSPLDIQTRFFDIYGEACSGKPSGQCTAASDRNQGGLGRLYQGTRNDLATGNTSAVNNGARTQRRDDAGSDELASAWSRVANEHVTRVRALLKPPSDEKNVASTATLQIPRTASPSPAPSQKTSK